MTGTYLTQYQPKSNPVLWFASNCTWIGVCRSGVESVLLDLRGSALSLCMLVIGWRCCLCGLCCVCGRLFLLTPVSMAVSQTAYFRARGAHSKHESIFESKPKSGRASTDTRMHPLFVQYLECTSLHALDRKNSQNTFRDSCQDNKCVV